MLQQIKYPFLNTDKQKILRNIERAEGVSLYDTEGNEYLDAISGLWNVILGYQQEQVNKKIVAQVKSVPFLNLWSNTNEQITTLAEKLLEKTDNKCSQLMYTTTGSETVELAIKMARKYQYAKGDHQKKYIVSFDLSYHGTTYGAMSVTGVDKEYFHEVSPMLKGVTLIPTYDETADIKKYIDFLENFFAENHEKIAAVLMEPVLAVAGILKMNPKIVKTLSELGKKYDILLISDEITTGFHRTGPFFGYQLFDKFTPDIICVSKGLTNGYLPLGVALFRKEMIEKLGIDNVVPHFSTQNGNPICCAAANAVIEVLGMEDYESMNEKKGSYIQEMLNKSLVGRSNVKEIRQEGMMIGIELCKGHGQEKLSFDEVWVMTEKLKENFLVVYPYATERTSGIILMPSYTITQAEIKKMTECLASHL